MAREICILPDVLVNQIAAGEVVERPASVVKELVENALDAGASHIAVEMEGGGKKRIRVLDNGSGMVPAQARLALQRHATSKLTKVEDLFGLDTFGFRGEALPSIASVSKMTLTTRSREEGSSAHRIEIEGGKIISEGEVGAPVGTCIEIKDLLYNVPARQKFLKGEATETSHITDVISKMALANPHVHFRLKNRSRTTINAPGHLNYAERVRAVMGARLGRNSQMSQGEYGGVRVQAFLASPEVAQSTTRGLQIFVGRRPVKDRGVLHAVMQGYDELIPRGRYPVAVILIDTPAGDVDVNVHPQKLEVRFSEPQLVYAAVRQVVRNGVANSNWGLDDEGKVQDGQLPVVASQAPPPGYSTRGNFGASDLAKRYAKEHAKMMLPWGRSRNRGEEQGSPARAKVDGAGDASEIKSDSESVTPVPAAFSEERLSAKAEQMHAESETRSGESEKSQISLKIGREGESSAQVDEQGAEGKTNSPVEDKDGGKDLRPGFFQSLRYIGQLDRTFLLCEGVGELVMLDQHVAHERVELEKLLNRYRAGKMPVQPLLFPQTVELSSAQAAAADTHGDQLAAMGFELDDFGEGEGKMSYALKSIPAGLRHGEPADVLVQVLNDLAKTGSGRAVDAKIESMLATVACHSVVRAGDVLSPPEVESLLAAMEEVDFRGVAPHGRPVLLRMGLSEIAKRFGRHPPKLI